MSDPVEIIVDNRIRIPRSTISSEVDGALREEFVHVNPAHVKLKNMGFGTANEPPLIKTWRYEVEKLTLPRGGMQRVRQVLTDHDLDWWVTDMRCGGLPHLAGKIPEHRVELRGYQREARDEAIATQNCLIRAPTGCLAGDTLIGVNRAGKGSVMRLDHVVKMMNGGASSGRQWKRAIPTFARARLDDGTVGLVQIVAAYESGVRQVYELKTVGGRCIHATADHRFLTSNGWRRLGELQRGMMLCTEDSRRPTRRGTAREKGRRKNYPVRVVKFHPYAGRKGVKSGKGSHTVPLHRLVVEADLNKMELKRFIEVLNAGPVGEVFDFIDPSTHVVHHVDGNPQNNRLSNLRLMTHEEHRLVHAEENARNLRSRTEFDPIRSVTLKGRVPTYDLAMAGPNNFVANGIVVHNSGKTTTAIAIAARLNLPTMVVVWNGALMDQWVARLHTELGMPKADIGIVRGKRKEIKPMTVAMQQTLTRATDDVWDMLNEAFAVVLCDEVQRFAANTFLNVIDRCTAKYRIGVSADECVAAGTMIRLPGGRQRAIEQLAPGDFVVTPSGPRRVRSVINTGIRQTVVVTANGRRLRCTRNTALGSADGWVWAESACYAFVYDNPTMRRGKGSGRPTEGHTIAEAGLGGHPFPNDVRPLEDAASRCSQVECEVEADGLALHTFDLEVEGAHCFFADDVLVHNTRKDRKEFIIYDVFGNVAHEVKARELEKTGAIVDVEVRVVPTDFRADWYIEQRKNPKLTPNFNRLLDEMTRDKMRNLHLRWFAQDELANGASLLVFSHRVDHCRELDSEFTAEGFKSRCMVGGEENEATFVEGRDGLKDGTVQVGVGTYQSIGTGHDIPTVTAGVASTPINNRQLWGQVRGRMCRPHEGKERGVVYYLWDRHVFGMQPLKNLVAWNNRVLVYEGANWVPARAFMAREER